MGTTHVASNGDGNDAFSLVQGVKFDSGPAAYVFEPLPEQYPGTNAHGRVKRFIEGVWDE